MDGLHLKLKLDTLAHHHHVEQWGKREPYLWTIFFKLDGSTVEVTPRFKLRGAGTFHFTEGSHGNLGITSWDDQEVSIPASIGEWNTYLEPFHIPHFEQKAPSIAGVIVVLMEQNNVSYQGAEAGHAALNAKVADAVNTAMADFDPRTVDINDVMGSIQRYFEEKVEAFTATIQNDIVKAIKGKQHLLRNLWTLLNPDNLIGYHVWNFNLQALTEAPDARLDFQHTWPSSAHGNWEIRGHAEAMPAPAL